MTPAERDDRDAWLRLSLIPGLGNAGLRQLLGALGPPDQVLATGSAELRRHVEAPVAAAIAAGGEATGAARALDWLEQPGNHVVTLADADYPLSLIHI